VHACTWKCCGRKITDSLSFQLCVCAESVDFFNIVVCVIAPVEFPQCVLRFARLRVLRLSGNKIRSVPSEIGALTELEDMVGSLLYDPVETVLYSAVVTRLSTGN
jgi:hypothetical protein